MTIATAVITDPQKIFDHVVRHLREQGGKCMEGTSCMYRSFPDENGKVKACAFGALIPNELYTPRLEYQAVRHLVGKREYPQLDVWKDPYTKTLLSYLQDAHDNAPAEDGKWDLKTSDDKKNIIERLEHIATMFVLRNTAIYEKSWH